MTAEHRQQQVNQHLDRLVTQQAITLRRIGLAGQTLLQSAQTWQRHSARLNKRIYATFQQCYHDHGTMDMAPHLYNGTAESSSFLQHETSPSYAGKGTLSTPRPSSVSANDRAQSPPVCEQASLLDYQPAQLHATVTPPPSIQRKRPRLKKPTAHRSSFVAQ
ncbi:hypothetical protein H4R35_000874, partial [Dimargaris xerosporica]